MPNLPEQFFIITVDDRIVKKYIRRINAENEMDDWRRWQMNAELWSSPLTWTREQSYDPALDTDPLF